MIFRTQNSTYEIDTAHKRIRRLFGENPPTSRLEPDGAWHTYLDVSNVQVGEDVYVAWSPSKVTILSVVVAIGSVDANGAPVEEVAA